MAENIRYRILMAKLKREIAATVRERTAPQQETQIVVKSTCKVCGSIV